MRTLTCLLLVLVIFPVLPSPIEGQAADSALVQPDTSRRTPDPRTALLLGLIPGGGQLYNHAWLKAALVLAAEGYLTYQFQNARQRYRESQQERDLEQRNKYAWQFLFVYILGLMDGYVDAHLSTFPPDTLYQVQPLLPSNRSTQEGP